MGRADPKHLHSGRTDDAPADRLHHVSCSAGADRGNVRIAGWLALDKARLEARLGAIEVDAIKEDAMEMEVGVRPRLHLMVYMTNNALVLLIPVTR